VATTEKAGVAMTTRALHVTYTREGDRLEGSITGLEPAVQFGDGRTLSVSIDADGNPVGFVIDDFRHFVDYYLLSELFGDQVIRPLAALQTHVFDRRPQTANRQIPLDDRRRSVTNLQRDGRLLPV